MLLNKITALRADITITFAKAPEKENVYVGTIVLKKNNREFEFDWNECSGEYNDKTLLLETRDLESMKVPDDATLEELKNAVVTDIFLQGDEDSYIEGQVITNIELCLYDAADNNNHICLDKKAFKNTDLGEYYDIIPFTSEYESVFKVGQTYEKVGMYGGVTTYTVKEIDRENNKILLAEKWIDIDGSGLRPAKWHKLEKVDGKERCLEWTSKNFGDMWIYAHTTECNKQ